MRSMKIPWSLCVAFACGSLLGPAAGQHNAEAPAVELTDAQRAATVARIQSEVAAIRGLSFKRPVKVVRRSAQELERGLDAYVGRMLPAEVAAHYGQIIRKLGLYRGPLISDFPAMMKMMLGTQVAAYYEPAENTFFVVDDARSQTLRGALYSHELHHGLQHQHFDLPAYLHTTADSSQDAVLARRTVVEGEAAYVMSLWLIQHLTGRPASRETLAPAIAVASRATSDSMRKLLAESTQGSGRLQDALEAWDRIPEYVLQTLHGAYQKGQAFVFAVHAGGWSQVDKLYRERPPLSTEQILHPEKWLAQEGFVGFTWPRFADEERLSGWKLLQQDVLGEFQWRIVFNEYGFKDDAEYAAAGWNGDRYAVFKREDSDAMLLLWRTSWDSVADATEFATLYRRLLASKYQGVPEAVRVVQRETEVAIVEGGTAEGLDGLLEVVNRARRE